MTDKHFEWFGKIISAYALCEVNIKHTLAALLKIDIGAVFALTDRVGSVALVTKLRAINRATPDEPLRDRIEEISLRLEKAAPIRNMIAHSTWAVGNRADSIRPTGLLVKTKGIEIRGFDDQEEDYDFSDLEESFNELVDIGTAFQLIILSDPYIQEWIKGAPSDSS
jgi:hypothetical protein